MSSESTWYGQRIQDATTDEERRRALFELVKIECLRRNPGAGVGMLDIGTMTNVFLDFLLAMTLEMGKRIAELEEAINELSAYASHDIGCPDWFRTNGQAFTGKAGPDAPCDCDLAELLAKGRSR
jgi:hypothetical protein